jgi:hypothetical protein
MRSVLRSSHFVLVAILMTFTDCLAQDATNLELRLQADPVKRGAPQTFSCMLVNKTDHDVYVPRLRQTAKTAMMDGLQ